jgi:hypothetical protein
MKDDSHIVNTENLVGETMWAAGGEAGRGGKGAGRTRSAGKCDETRARTCSMNAGRKHTSAKLLGILC